MIYFQDIYLDTVVSEKTVYVGHELNFRFIVLKKDTPKRWCWHFFKKGWDDFRGGTMGQLTRES